MDTSLSGLLGSLSSLSFKQGALLTVGLLLVFKAISILLNALQNATTHPLCSVPGPALARILPSYMSYSVIRGKRAQTLRDLHNAYGSVVRIGPNEVSISDWQMYRKIYSAKASSKQEAFYSAATFIGHENIFTFRDKAAHSARRKMQSQPFAQSSIVENESLIASRASALVERALEAVSDAHGRSINILNLIHLFSLEVIMACGFNMNRDDMEGTSLRLLHAMDLSAATVPIRSASPLPASVMLRFAKYLPGFVGHAFRGTEQWKCITADMARTFRSKSVDTSQRFMATPFFENTDTFLGRKLSSDEVLEESMGLMFAGSGTTSTTLAYLVYALSLPSGQGYQDKLREELRQASTDVGSHRRLDLTKLASLPMLNAIINETYRLYPTIISTLPRVLDQPLIVEVHTPTNESKTITLPAGTDVGMQNFCHHRDPLLFPNPDEFIPERWLGDQVHVRDMHSALTPFSIGPRNCLGQNLAKAELWIAVAEIFSRLEITIGEGMNQDDMEMEDRFSVAPKGRRLFVDVKEVDREEL